MILEEEAIGDFKRLYFQEYGIKLADQEAVEYGTRLIRFVKAVYGNNFPIKGDIDGQRKKDNN